MTSPSAPAVTIYQRQAPRFTAQADPIAYAVHLAFVSNGFRLIGLDDDLNGPDQQYEGLPGTWNTTPGMYTFRYRQETVVVVVKCVVVDESLLVHANRSGSDQISTLELVIVDYLQPDYDLQRPASIYSNLDDLVALVFNRIVQQFQAAVVKPRLQARAFYDEDGDEDYNDPLRVRRPVRPAHGDFDGDLGPGPIDPFQPDSGGNYMGPDHPMFIRGRGRGRGRIPRFDPFGPDRGFGGDPNRDIFMPPGFGGPGHFPF